MDAKLKQFAASYGQALCPLLPPEELERAAESVLRSIASGEERMSKSRQLRLLVTHQCVSSGCSDVGCMLCQYNPNRTCTRNLRPKYLIDDGLLAKCGAPLQVMLVDGVTGELVLEGLPEGTHLAVEVVSGEVEAAGDEPLPPHELRSLVVRPGQPLLRRSNGTSGNSMGNMRRGYASLSDLAPTTSSEVVMGSKAPLFRLLLWAVDSATGQPVENVTHAVSEGFVVATRRVKHAMKADVPNCSDSVDKLVHVGRATVEKLADLRATAMEEGVSLQSLPDDLNNVARIGQFQRLAELALQDADLGRRLQNVLRLSKRKWDELVQHAKSSVVADYRHRVWREDGQTAVGVVFDCQNGEVMLDVPCAVMHRLPDGSDEMVPSGSFDAETLAMLPKLKARAVNDWYAPSHPHWAVVAAPAASGEEVPAVATEVTAVVATPAPAALPEEEEEEVIIAQHASFFPFWYLYGDDDDILAHKRRKADYI